MRNAEVNWREVPRVTPSVCIRVREVRGTRMHDGTVEHTLLARPAVEAQAIRQHEVPVVAELAVGRESEHWSQPHSSTQQPTATAPRTPIATETHSRTQPRTQTQSTAFEQTHTYLVVTSYHDVPPRRVAYAGKPLIADLIGQKAGRQHGEILTLQFGKLWLYVPPMQTRMYEH